MARRWRSARSTDDVPQFESKVRAVAHAIVHQVLVAEVARRQAATTRPRGDASRKRRTEPTISATIVAEASLALAVERPNAAREAATALAPAASPSENGADGRRRPRWTRESVIDELSTWLRGRHMVEAAFLLRHGPPGLVANAKRIFGRFDAALNAANLHIAREALSDVPKTKQSFGSP